MTLKDTFLRGAASAALMLAGLVSSASAQTWTGTWSVSPEATSFTGFNNLSQQTLRQLLHASIGGSVARVHISNVFGKEPLLVRDVQIGRAAADDSNGNPTSSTVSGSNRFVTFSGLSSVTIPAGSEAISDPVIFTINPNSDLAVSMYFPDGVDNVNSTFHQDGGQQGMFLANGNVSRNSTISTNSSFSSYFYLTGVDVEDPTATGTLVTLGASITDGINSSFNKNLRWTNDLATRLLNAGLQIGVNNQGISGNQLLADGAGQSALNRFQRDVLSQPNVRWVIFSDDPINDLLSHTPPPSAASLISGVQSLIAQVHAQGIKFICSTLTPYQGYSGWTPEQEPIREQINTFIRDPSSGCDGIIDQDAAVHDPTMPTFYLPAFNGGDGLHPNDAGMQAIANSVDLDLFTSLELLPINPLNAKCTTGLLLKESNLTNLPCPAVDDAVRP